MKTIEAKNGVIIGKNRKLSYVDNVRRVIEWFLKEFTAEGVVSNLAMYKLFTGKKPFVPRDEQFAMVAVSEEELHNLPKVEDLFDSLP